MTMADGTIPPLDAILKAHALHNPHAPALIDPPDCARITGEAPRRFTYAQADRAVGAIAARLREIGLGPGTVVGVQMPNFAAGIVAMLGIMRAGMIAAPLPLLWRRGDCLAALTQADARAIVTCGRVAGFDHAALALEIAAGLFPIRAVCGFGCGSADGIVPFDDLLSGADEHPDTILFRDAPRAGFAVVTFDSTAGGIVPVARDAAQLLAGGRLVWQRGRLGPNAVILSTLPASSFAGIAAALVPWLLSGGTLALHHPFDADILRDQIASLRCDVLVVPDPLLTGLCQSGLLDRGVRSVVSVWRAPERIAGAAPWPKPEVTLVDVAAFGEAALLAARRAADGRTRPWRPGPLTIADDGKECAHLALTSAGSLGVRGALAATPFPLTAAENGADALPGRGHVDTGYPCRAIGDDEELVVTAPPAGLIGVGGYRFSLHALQQLIRGIDCDGMLAALPHALSGHRLAGYARDPAAMRATLQTMGAPPLLTSAFRDRAA